MSNEGWQAKPSGVSGYDQKIIISLGAFEGPFDLLRDKKVDLGHVSLAEVTDDFLRYVNDYDLSVNTQADFAVVAATMVLLKLKGLLPSLGDVEEEEEIASLTDRLQIYQQYRRQAMLIKGQWAKRQLQNGPNRAKKGLVKVSVSGKSLALALSELVERISSTVRPTQHLRPRGTNIRQWQEKLALHLTQVRELLLFDVAEGRRENISAVLLAALEMSQRVEVKLVQEEFIAPIMVKPYE